MAFDINSNTQVQPFTLKGYTAGAGGAVTQATSKGTGVTLNAPTGQITLNAASLAAGAAVSFLLTNSYIASTDVLLFSTSGGVATGGTYAISAAVLNGSANIAITNLSAGALAEAVVINYVLLKGANS